MSIINHACKIRVIDSMKKLLSIIFLSLVFYVNPLTISDSNAGWFSDPLEKCMNRVIKGTFNGNERLSADAAQLCLGN